MTDFDFDRVIDRRATDSNKWRKFPADVLPLWVADMDFASPPAVVRALRDRVEHGFFGYLTERHDLPEVVVERVAKRYGWRVSPEAVVTLPGVIAGLAGVGSCGERSSVGCGRRARRERGGLAAG